MACNKLVHKSEAKSIFRNKLINPYIIIIHIIIYINLIRTKPEYFYYREYLVV